MLRESLASSQTGPTGLSLPSCDSFPRLWLSQRSFLRHRNCCFHRLGAGAKRKPRPEQRKQKRVPVRRVLVEDCDFNACVRISRSIPDHERCTVIFNSCIPILVALLELLTRPAPALENDLRLLKTHLLFEFFLAGLLPQGVSAFTLDMALG